MIDSEQQFIGKSRKLQRKCQREKSLKLAGTKLCCLGEESKKIN